MSRSSALLVVAVAAMSCRGQPDERASAKSAALEALRAKAQDLVRDPEELERRVLLHTVETKGLLREFLESDPELAKDFVISASRALRGLYVESLLAGDEGGAEQAAWATGYVVGLFQCALETREPVGKAGREATLELVRTVFGAAGGRLEFLEVMDPEHRRQRDKRFEEFLEDHYTAYSHEMQAGLFCGRDPFLTSVD